jgi:chemotaxis protein MotA
MKISYGSILGLLIAIIALGLALQSYESSYFLNLEAALIVFGGTLAATMISFEGKEVFRALGAMRELIVPSPIDDKSMMSEVQTVVDWGKINAKEGKLGLERAFEESDMTRDRFLQYSIDLFSAGYSVDSLRAKMETFVSNQYEQEKKSVEILTTMGTFSPAFGMIGTLIGLVGMLSQLDDFAGKIGEPMAVALVTTFYGAVAQQLLFKPAAQRTDAKNRVLLTRNLMMTEAFLLLVSNKGSMEIQDHLNSFLRNTPNKKVSNETEVNERS